MISAWWQSPCAEVRERLRTLLRCKNSDERMQQMQKGYRQELAATLAE